ncbi:MAG: hypothetical protein HOO67_06930 [Candidatus Peribacteraceae bacterium]|nr:hypothetical protein [Candidatus Peribacteraceae bacterium]
MVVKHSCDYLGALQEFETLAQAHSDNGEVKGLFAQAQVESARLRSEGLDVACSAVVVRLERARALAQGVL